MCTERSTIENCHGLCKGVVEAVAGMMVPRAASCGRDARGCARLGALQKNLPCHTPLALGGGVAGHSNIAMLFHLQGRYAEAQARFQIVLELGKRTLEEDHALMVPPLQPPAGGPSPTPSP
jgi:hypothetical protein